MHPEKSVLNQDRGDVQIALHLCKGCRLCLLACPPAVLAQSQILNSQGYYPIAYNGSGCTGCGICFYVCPEPGAITVRIRQGETATHTVTGLDIASVPGGHPR